MTTTSTNLLDIILPFLFPIVVLSFIVLSIWLVMTLIRRNNQPPPEKSGRRVAKNTRNARPSSGNSNPPPLIQVRHVPTGQWEIRIQGQRYSNLEAVPDDALRQEVVQGLRALAAFARSYVKGAGATRRKKQQTGERPPQASVPQQPKPTAAQPQPTTPPATAPSADERPSAPQRDQAPRPGPSFRMLREPALKRHEAAPELMPTIDLAREIGDIVDEMKARNPDLANRSIRLYNSPGGGIYFAVDGETFENVDEISDMQIQGLIRAATKEWERR